MEEHGMQPDESLSKAFSSRDASLTSTSQYGGLLDIPFSTQVKNAMLVVNSHIDQIVPTWAPLHFIVGLLRFAQLLGPVFFAGDSSVYTIGTAPYLTASYVSIIYRYIPAGVTSNVLTIGLFTYSAILLLFYLAFLSISITYKKTAKLSDSAAYFLSFFISTFGYLLHPFAGSVAGELIGNMIESPPKDITLPIVSLITATICYVVYFYMISNIFARSIYFKPDSIQFVSGDNLLILFANMTTINLIYGVAIKLSMIPKIILIIIGILLYGYGAVSVSHGPSFVQPKQFSHFAGYSFTGIICSIITIVLVVTGKRGDMLYFIGVIVISILSLLLTTYTTNLLNNHQLILLDSVEEDETAELTISVKKYLMAVVAGFNAAHPFCVSFKCFDTALNTWPDNIDILCNFAKFIAIYPECTKRLVSIQNRMCSLKINRTSRQLIHQILMVIDKRENVVSPSLKKKMNVATKKLNAAKRKIQNIWDIIIQSNIPELGSAVNAAYNASNAAELELVKLKIAFPNNTIVSRLYFKFLREVKHNLAASLAEQDIIRRLRRGELAVADRVNELGVRAFPNIPCSTTVTISEKLSTTELLESDIIIDDESTVAEVEENTHLSQKVHSFRLPSIRHTIIGSICVIFFVSILPIIFLLSFDSYYINQIIIPAEHMNAVSVLRELNFQMASVMTRIALEEFTGKFDPLYPPDYVPVTMNSSKKSRDHLAMFISSVSKNAADIDQIRDFQRGDKLMDKIRGALFQNTIPFTYYRNTTSFENTTMSAVNILLDTALQASRFLEEKPLTDAILTKTEFLNPRLNVENVGLYMSTVLSAFDNYVVEQCTLVQSFVQYCQIIYSIFVAAIFFSVIWHSIVTTHKEINEVYISLTHLPKNVVSHAADSIRALKRESSSINESTSSQESNKQEETIIKVFMSANENTNSNSLMNAAQIFTTIVAIAGTLVAINLLLILYSDQYQILLINAPHLDFIAGTSAYMYGALNCLNSITLSNSYKKIDDNMLFYITNFESRMDRFVNYYNKMRYGGSSTTESPFTGFKEAVDIAEKMLMCEDMYKPPSSLLEAFPCYGAETQFILYVTISKRIAEPFIQKNVDKTFTGNIDPEDDLKIENTDLNILWTLGPIVIYDTFIKPLDLMMMNTIHKEMKQNVPKTMTVSIIMIFIVILANITLILLVKKIENTIKFYLSLILHIDPKVVASTNKIMAILSGNILNNAVDSSTRDTVFYEEVVDKLINGVVVIDESNKIMSMNSFIIKNFTTQGEEFIGKDISTLFDGRFGGEVSHVIDKNNAIGGLVTFGDDSYQITKCSARQRVILNIKNETARINHSKLIAEERAKSDMMLSSILPASLVPRVQAGEKNISFAVQSASVLFLDIVSFTPWCSSNKAAYVMKTLNMLFKGLDSALKEYPMLTKVKCIGDCYMAAGGLFADVNQPAVHAKQCVEFGLRAIEVVKQLDVELNEKLQIRVGVNTGGPIVAGVIGTGKPTFEIIGPVINMAQQMEHHGVPMCVHVSRATYELIYGNSFKIKERGQIEVKNTKVSTYLVTE